MYTEKLTLGFDIMKFIKKNLKEMSELFPATNFKVNNDPTDLSITLTSENSDEFNRALNGTKRMISKLSNDNFRYKMKKKIEKEKRNRKKMINAVKEIKKNISNSQNQEKTKLNVIDLNNENLFKNNMFYGLQLDATCP